LNRTFLIPHVAPTIIPATDPGVVSVLKRGAVFLLTDQAGDSVPNSEGLRLYLGDTRMLSCLVLLVNGERPSVLRPDPGGGASGTIVLTNPDPSPDPGRNPRQERTLAARSIGLVRERWLVAGLHERLALANYTDHANSPTIDLLLDADMADIFEVRGFVRARRGHFRPIEVREGQADFEYRGLDGRTFRTRVTAEGARIEPAHHDAEAALRVRWRPRIEPGARTTLEWSILPDVRETGVNSGEGIATVSARDIGVVDAPREASAGPGGGATPETADGLRDATEIRSDNPAFDRVVARCIGDLDLLITPGPGPGQRFLAAGIPWFTALFGRDAILASLGALLVDPSLAVDTLRVLASLQATAEDPSRDAEPGKIPHEVRGGEMARTGEVPFGRYYGSADVTPLWLVLLGETYDWTGDLGLVEELWPNARAALEWVEHHGDLDGVITDTAEHHFRAWQRLAAEISLPFDRELNERLKGVSRMESLEIILEHAGRRTESLQDKVRLAERKNTYFRELIDAITPADLLPGIADLLVDLRAHGMKTAIASMSHNVWDVVGRLGIEPLIDLIVDPAALVKGKPDPEIFLAAAEQLGVRFENCVGIEDARAGVEAIKAARMVAVGIGRDLPGADWLVAGTGSLTVDALEARFASAHGPRALRTSG
jgi:beta-phosphoglucomutase